MICKGNLEEEEEENKGKLLDWKWIWWEKYINRLIIINR